MAKNQNQGSRQETQKESDRDMRDDRGTQSDRDTRGDRDLGDAAREMRQGDSQAASELGREGGRARGGDGR